jgi:hypothetical protein
MEDQFGLAEAKQTSGRSSFEEGSAYHNLDQFQSNTGHQLPGMTASTKENLPNESSTFPHFSRPGKEVMYQLAHTYNMICCN